MTDALTAPFPYFGGKRNAAPIVWRALGDPSNYVEPFAGSAAVLLARPPFSGNRVETLNDADGWLVNAWRAIRHAPNEVAAAAFGPVTEIDSHARLAWLQQRRTQDLVAWLEGDPECYDAKAAGWWLYVCACEVGRPDQPGPWRVVDGLLTNTSKLPPTTYTGQGIQRNIPHLGNAGMGIQRSGLTGEGICRKIPHLMHAGRGIQRSGLTGEEQLKEYLQQFAKRLTRVRITCGSWERVVTPAALHYLSPGDGSRAIFLDPPYSTSGDVYQHGDTEISDAVREWCLTKADPSMRIVLCGYDREHEELEKAGWTVMAGKSGAGSGYSKRKDNGRRERLWLSPACLSMELQGDLFAETMS